ncbi:hypothetical protein [Microbacterium sp. NIBRBAC000506063]|uniref:hypothetical protein n=1 Tax=Microbacterium sp. NIBRBAC000506063 TaxID=2734618 RepID=UPI001BB5620A|nr:hypothetical protein [Microbacterium sp. NIBRBAC000506063]QTV79497.1 hypothetical protein KAE78_11380 [Microbacterium sp. NIBRBAC000506063]
MSYTAIVTREGDTWIGDVQELAGAHTFARNLPALRRNLQEVVGLVLDAPDDETFEISLRFEGVPDDFAAAVALGERRHELEEQQKELADSTAKAAARLAAQGWSVRDIATALHITPGRVSQVVSPHAA